jgi:hypothetical protein
MLTRNGLRSAIRGLIHSYVMLDITVLASQPAHAHRVKKVCEEVVSKTGTVEKCRWVLDKESLQTPPKADKDAKKADAGSKK